MKTLDIPHDQMRRIARRCLIRSFFHLNRETPRAPQHFGRKERAWVAHWLLRG
jgi:hypothetical protein